MLKYTCYKFTDNKWFIGKSNIKKPKYINKEIQMLKYLSSYKKELFFGPILKLIEAIIEVGLPYIIANIINNLEVTNNNLIIKYTVIMIIMIIVGLVCAISAQYIAAKTSQGFGTNLRNETFSHVLKLSNRQIEKLGSSAIVNRITNDVLNLEVAVAMFIRLVIRVPFIFIGSLIMVGTLNIKIAKILLISTILLGISIYVIIKKASKFQKLANEKLDKISLKVKENLVNVRAVRSFCSQNKEKKKFEEANNQKYKLDKKANIFSNLLNPISMIILDITIAFILYNGVIEINIGNLSKGSLIAIINYISQMILAVVVLSNLITIYTKSFVSSKRIKEILSINPDLTNNEIKEHLKQFEDNDIAVEFKNVYFEYEKDKPFLKNINLQISNKEKIGIIGLTGSGKSTLLQLINRNYDVTKGEIKVFNQDITLYNLKQLKNNIKLIEQKPSFFSNTIEENVKMGKDISKQELIEALKKSDSYEFIEKMKDGIYTKLENNANNLSGGQKQRISISRAFVGDAKILLLDDTTNALDYKTESNVLNNLFEYVDEKNITLFITSQRISTVSKCDKIIVMKNGKIESIGTHEELLKKSKIYIQIAKMNEKAQ